MCRYAYVWDLGGTFPEMQWVAHTYEWEPKTLVGIFGLGRKQVRGKHNGRNYRKYP